MEQRQIIFRLYSNLEISHDEPLYDVLERHEQNEKLNRQVTFRELDPGLIQYLKDSRDPIILLIPAEFTRKIQLGVVLGSNKKALQAAPFLVEESLASNLDSTHIAAERDHSSKQTTAVIIQHDRLRHCLGQFLSEGISVGCVFRDVDTLERGIQPRLRIAGNRVIVKTSNECSALSLDNIELYLGAIAAAELGEIQVCIHVLHSVYEPQLPDVMKSMEISHLTDHWFPEQFELSDSSINLAQGQYAPNTSWLCLRRSQKVFIGCMYLASIVLSSAYFGFGVRYEHSSNQLYDQQVTLYKKLFPLDKKIVNLRAQFAQHLGQMAGRDERDQFAKLLHSSLNKFGEITGYRDGGIRHLQYQSSPPQLGLEVLVESVKKLDTFEKALSQEGLNTRIASITQEEDTFLGRIQVSTECYQC